MKNEGKNGEEKEEILKLKGLLAERDITITVNELGKVIIYLEKGLKAKQSDFRKLDIANMDKKLLDHHKQIAEEEMKRAYNLEIENKKLNKEIKGFKVTSRSLILR